MALLRTKLYPSKRPVPLIRASIRGPYCRLTGGGVGGESGAKFLRRSDSRGRRLSLAELELARSALKWGERTARRHTHRLSVMIGVVWEETVLRLRPMILHVMSFVLNTYARP